jgi:hypothetical protein
MAAKREFKANLEPGSAVAPTKPAVMLSTLNAGRANANIARSMTSGEAAMTGIGRRIVYVVLVIVVLLVIWQFLASL